MRKHISDQRSKLVCRRRWNIREDSESCPFTLPPAFVRAGEARGVFRPEGCIIHVANGVASPSEIKGGWDTPRKRAPDAMLVAIEDSSLCVSRLGHFLNRQCLSAVV